MYRKITLALIAAASLSAMALAPSAASAKPWGGGWGGGWGGDNWPDRDYPRYCRLLSYEKLNLEPLRSNPYRLDQINEALHDLESGKVSRPLIDLTAN